MPHEIILADPGSEWNFNAEKYKLNNLIQEKLRRKIKKKWKKEIIAVTVTVIVRVFEGEKDREIDR